MRQIILDTETTGLEAEQGHRIIEIGCVELLNRRVTGRRFHRYLNPERGFLNAELARLEGEARRVADLCRVLDTLGLARSLHPGQRNSLDALCKRYGIDNSGRDLHGALLDAQLLADVYLAMTGGQSALALHDESTQRRGQNDAPQPPRWQRPAEALIVRAPSAAELAAHEALLERVAKASGGKVLFRAAAGEAGSA
jgi:DNA polymerase-3 subunit epsilon